MTVQQIEILKKKIERLKKSQAEAERLLEEKSRELFEVNQGLEKKIEERVAELKIAKDIAEKATLAQERFVANISHEIRTPLNGAINSLEFLKSTPLNEEQKKYVDMGTSSGKILLDLVSDILDFSKIKSGEYSISKEGFNLHDMLESLQIFFKSQKIKPTVSINYDIQIPSDTVILSDSARIKQILVNLIGNALKFTDDGTVSVVASLTDKDIIFTISDTGPGISQLDLTEIFDPFKRASNKKGTGLGLFICSTLADALSGQLTATSELGRGSEFILRIPYEQPLANQTIASPDHAAKNSLPNNFSQHILIAEDNEINLFVLTEMLKDLSITFDVAKNGQEAVELTSQYTYSLILMDCQMPIMSGLDATREIRKIPNIEQPTIIALTANSTEKSRKECLEAGMDRFLSKPLKKSDLLSELTQVFKNPQPSS